MSDDQITIETPEHIEVHYELAGIGSRALAALFDFMLQGLITGLLVWGVIWLGTALRWEDALGIVFAIIIGAVSFLAFTLYYVLAEMLTAGQSPGKTLAGLRVIGLDGRPLTFLQSVLRNIIRVVDMLPFIYTVGLFAVFFSKRAQRLGDMVAGTVVVKERLHEPPQHAAPLEGRDVGGLVAGIRPPDLPPDVQARLRASLHLLTPAELGAAERLVERRYELAQDVRSGLVRQIAEPLLAKLTYVQESDFPDLEVFLEAVVRAWRGRPL